VVVANFADIAGRYACCGPRRCAEIGAKERIGSTVVFSKRRQEKEAFEPWPMVRKKAEHYPMLELELRDPEAEMSRACRAND